MPRHSNSTHPSYSLYTYATDVPKCVTVSHGFCMQSGRFPRNEEGYHHGDQLTTRMPTASGSFSGVGNLFEVSSGSVRIVMDSTAVVYCHCISEHNLFLSTLHSPILSPQNGHNPGSWCRCSSASIPRSSLQTPSVAYFRVSFLLHGLEYSPSCRTVVADLALGPENLSIADLASASWHRDFAESRSICAIKWTAISRSSRAMRRISMWRGLLFPTHSTPIPTCTKRASTVECHFCDASKNTCRSLPGRDAISRNGGKCSRLTLKAHEGSHRRGDRSRVSTVMNSGTWS